MLDEVLAQAGSGGDELIGALLSKMSSKTPKLLPFRPDVVSGDEAQFAMHAATNPFAALPFAAMMQRNNAANAHTEELTRQYNDAMLHAMQPSESAANNEFLKLIMQHGDKLNPVSLAALHQYRPDFQIPVPDESSVRTAYDAQNIEKPRAGALSDTAKAAHAFMTAGHMPNNPVPFLEFGTGRVSPFTSEDFTRIPTSTEVQLEGQRLNADAVKEAAKHSQEAAHTRETTVPVKLPNGQTVFEHHRDESRTGDVTSSEHKVPSQSPTDPRSDVSTTGTPKTTQELVDRMTQAGFTDIKPGVDAGPYVYATGTRNGRVYTLRFPRQQTK